uniref:Methyltransferase type 11 n=1 Tax=Cyanothece sp. (strain PCC 7425 / ATCC 29141) TaxID=395961 RepID=B8HY93_CYAP4
MHVSEWIATEPESILDVGCNVGAWLVNCRHKYPNTRLAGVEPNAVALAVARQRLPTVDFFQSGAENLPFPDQSFQYVTCTEVLEHLPSHLWSVAFSEMQRVLQPGGRLILTTPHAGWFAWLDSNNIRFRLPQLYRMFIGRGLRDAPLLACNRKVEWHYHFTKDELINLSGSGWKIVATQYGGLLLYPLMDYLSWPFYRLRLGKHPMRLFLQQIAGWDYSIDYGLASYGILLVLERKF